MMRYISAIILFLLLGSSIARSQVIVPEDFLGITAETYGEGPLVPCFSPYRPMWRVRDTM